MALDADCVDGYLPVTESNYCAPDVNFGEIELLFFTTIGNPLTDAELLSEWETRLANEDADEANPDLTKIRQLNVVGDKPAPDRPELTISRGRKISREGEHTVNISVDETGETNYTMLQEIEEKGGQFLIWYVVGKYLYGGNSGIEASLLLNDIIPGSRTELQTFAGTVKWQGNHPDRVANPFG